MIRRDAVVLAGVTAAGLLLGSLLVMKQSVLEHLRQSSRGIPARTSKAFDHGIKFHLEIETERDLPVVQEARNRIAADGFAGALQRIRAELATRGQGQPELLRVEELALRQLVEPDTLPRRSTTAEDGRVWRSRRTDVAFLLAARPAGIGDADHPLRPLARAYVASLLARVSTRRDSRSLIALPLAEMVGADAGALVDVLSAWASLSRLIAEDEPLLTNGRVRRDVCVELCQSLLDRNQEVRGLCDGLAEIAADSDRPQMERALAAMALSELANIPIGLGWDLPRDEAEAAKAPRFTLTRIWRNVRDQGAEEGFAARVELAVRGWDALSPGAMSFDPPAAARRHFRGARRWLDMQVDPNARGPQLGSAREIAARSVSPIEYLSALAGGTTEPARLIARMESDERLRLPLHHLLLLTNAAEGSEPPRRTATTDREGIVGAWRTALGLDQVPFTLRVARLERRLDGLTLLDERRELVRADTRGAIRWSQRIPEPLANATWTPPGGVREPGPTARMTEDLVVVIRLDEDGARIEVDDLSLRIDPARGGGSSSSSGASIPLGIPTALTPWNNSDSPASRRGYLVMVTRGESSGVEWSLDDWRAASVAALDDIAGTADRDAADHAGRCLGESLALLRPQVDVEELLRLDGLASGPGVRRALALAGVRAPSLQPDDAPFAVAINRGLSHRERAELALDAPDADVRATMWRLLGFHTPRASPLLAEEILEIASAEPGRVPADVVDDMTSIVASTATRGANTVFEVIAAVMWAIAGLLLALCLFWHRRPHGGRGTAALLLVAALVIAQVDVFVSGRSLTPGWSGWALAALAVWLIGRGRVERAMSTAATFFAFATLASAAAQLTAGPVETALSTVEALAALAGCVALGPLAPALLHGLGPAGSTDLPRRPRPRPRWGMGAQVVIAAAIAGITAVAVAEQIIDPSGFVQLYAAPALCFGGVLIWRVSLVRGARAKALPLPFLLGLVVPGLILLVTDATARGPGGVSLTPLPPWPRVWIACALLFALIRVYDAARIRGRADAAGAT